MKIIKILLIGLILVGFAIAQDITKEPVELDEYETNLMARYKLVTNALDQLTIEKANIEYAWNMYKASKDIVEVEEPVGDDKKKKK